MLELVPKPKSCLPWLMSLAFTVAPAVDSTEELSLRALLSTLDQPNAWNWMVP